MAVLPSTPAKRLSDVTLPPCHLDAAEIKALEEIVGRTRFEPMDYERAFHARGKSYHDLLYVRAGDLDVAPDAVVYPRATTEVQSVITYCSEHDMTVVPFGGGSSVVGGVNATARSATDKVITLDLTLMDGVHDVDKVAMTARVDAGIYGPHLEEKLNAQGLTLGHYPQSFEYSTLGGWIAARGAGQQSNRYGKAEKWVVSARLATPNGPWSTEEFPASAAGPNLNQLVAGSGRYARRHLRCHREDPRKTAGKRLSRLLCSRRSRRASMSPAPSTMQTFRLPWCACLTPQRPISFRPLAQAGLVGSNPNYRLHI